MNTGTQEHRNPKTGNQDRKETGKQREQEHRENLIAGAQANRENSESRITRNTGKRNAGKQANKRVKKAETIRRIARKVGRPARSRQAERHECNILDARDGKTSRDADSATGKQASLQAMWAGRLASGKQTDSGRWRDMRMHAVCLKRPTERQASM